MVLYISRDYLSQNTTTTNRTYIHSYVASLFLRRILGYSYVGDTNYPINGIGSLLIATGDSTPTSTPTFSVGDRAGISNTGATVEVHIPVGIRTVVSGDIGKILVLKSTRYPTRNSGIFLITAINTGLNRYVIDYRSADAPPPETDSIDWYLYEADISCPAQGTGNGSGNYGSNGASNTPRIILQSPHAMGWQVRICNESTADSTRSIFNGATAPITFAPGFGGNASGDFSIGGEHLHGTLFYNVSGSPTNATYMTGNGMGDDAAAGFQFRYTLIGDDTGQSFHIFARRLNDLTTNPQSMYLSFGIPDNEPAPLPIKDIERLYVWGSARGNTGNGSVNGISLAVGSTIGGVNSGQGTTFRYAPITCNPSTLAYVVGNNQLAGPTFETTAIDSPFIGATELISVDLISGLFYSWEGGTPPQTWRFYPRVIGSMPIIKNGRANFGIGTLTTDTGTWSVQTATNASPIQITTTAANNLVTGQTVSIHSVGGNTAANGTFTVTVINSTNFTLDGSTGNGAYTSGGNVLRGASWRHMRNGIFIPWNGPAVIA